VPWAIALLSFVVAFAALRVILWRFGRHALDQPNERSLHERPVPRTGGIAVLLRQARQETNPGQRRAVQGRRRCDVSCTAPPLARQT